MKVTSPEDYSWVTVLARGVAKGEVVDVATDVGDGLVTQGWKLEKKPTKPSGASRTEEK